MKYESDRKFQLNKDDKMNNAETDSKKISKSIGEYVDYEEVRKEDE